MAGYVIWGGGYDRRSTPSQPFVHLTAPLDRDERNDSGLVVNFEVYTPPSHAGFLQVTRASKRRGNPGVAGVAGQFVDANTNSRLQAPGFFAVWYG